MDLERARNLSRQILTMEPQDSEGLLTRERFESIGKRIEALEPTTDHGFNLTHFVRLGEHGLSLKLTNHYAIHLKDNNQTRELRGMTAKWSRDIEPGLSGENETVMSIEHVSLGSAHIPNDPRSLGLIEESVAVAEIELGAKSKK